MMAVILILILKFNTFNGQMMQTDVIVFSAFTGNKYPLLKSKHLLHHICLIIPWGRKLKSKQHKMSVQFLQSKQSCTFWEFQFRQISCRFCSTPHFNVTPCIPAHDVGNHPVRTSWLAGDKLPWFTTYAISNSGKHGDRCCNDAHPSHRHTPHPVLMLHFLFTLLSAVWSNKLTQGHIVSHKTTMCFDFGTTAFCSLWFLVGHRMSWFHFPRCPLWVAVGEETITVSGQCQTALDDALPLDGEVSSGWNQADPSCRHIVCIAWELVSTVSKTRARAEKNQMWPLADGSQGAPQSLDQGGSVTSLARWLTH